MSKKLTSFLIIMMLISLVLIGIICFFEVGDTNYLANSTTSVSVLTAETGEDTTDPTTYQYIVNKLIKDNNGGCIIEEYSRNTLNKGDYIVNPITTPNGYNTKFYIYDDTSADYKGSEFTAFGSVIESDLTIVAETLPVEYTIKYYLLDGTELTNLAQTYTVEDSVELAVYSPDIESHEKMLYWMDSSNKKIENFEAGKTGNLVLYANIAKMHSVNLYSSADTLIATLTDVATVEIIDRISLEAIRGYDTVCKYSSDDNGITFSINDVIKSDITADYGTTIDLYLSYTIKYYLINYNYSGGKLAEGTISKSGYNILTEDFTLVNPIRYGYDFAGWTGTDLSEATMLVTIAQGSIGTRNYVATWTPKTVLVNYDVALGDELQTRTFYVAYAGMYGDLVTPTRTGYTFDGWYYSTKPITNSSIVELENTHTIVAKWSAKTYTITYEANGGTINNATKQVNYNSVYNLEVPTRAGYTFKDWYYNGATFNVAGTYLISDNITISARWEANSINVVIHARDYSSQKTIIFDSTNIDLHFAEMDNVDEYLIGFYTQDKGRGTMLANSNCIVSKWEIATNIDVYAFYLCETSYINNAEFYPEALSTTGYDLYVDNIKLESNSTITKVGYHNIALKSGIEVLAEKTILIKADLGIVDNKVYSSPIYLNNVDGDLYVDGKLIEDSTDYRFDMNGTHLIEIKGKGGYIATYSITYKNSNYTRFWYLLGITSLFAIAAIVMLCLGRKGVSYDNNRE